MNRAAAELLGTFCIVFAGTGAVVVDHVSGGQISHAGVALTFGLVVMAMIYALGETSGAHLNPAVTIAFAISGRLPGSAVPIYLAAQCAGALVASMLIALLFGHAAGLGRTAPAASSHQAFVLEAVITFMLMLVVLAVSTGPKERGIMAGIAVGGTVAVGALFAGPITGASMNPARSLGPALVSGELDHLWIYLAAPVVGAAAAVPISVLITPAPRRAAPTEHAPPALHR